MRVFLREPRQIRPDETTLLFLYAGIVGILGGFGAIIFKYLTAIVQRLFLGSWENLLDAALQLPWYYRILVPTAGGTLASFILYSLAKKTKSYGISDIMEAVSLRGGEIEVRSVLFRSLSSLMIIGSGGSVGREGPIVQIGAMLASQFGQLLRISRIKLSILVGCGVASGMAAAYNTPIAAAIFVLEIIMGNFATDIFAPVVISSVAATLVSRGVMGNQPTYRIPPFSMVSHFELIFYVFLGILAGFAAYLFIEALFKGEEIFKKIKIPAYFKIPLGGFLVGILGLSFPHVWGNGYEVASRILNQQLPGPLVLILFFLKIIATAITVGSGGSGGVFTPSLFVGAALGGAVGNAVNYFFPLLTAPSGAYALVGMGCLLAGTTHAPIMAILIIFELTLDYGIILPLMLSCILSSYVASKIKPESIYTERLKQRGIQLSRGMEEMVLYSMRVQDILKTGVSLLPENLRFDEILKRFYASRSDYLYVGDQRGNLLGVINLHDIKEFLSEKDLETLVIAKDLATPVSVAYPMDRLADVLEKFWLQDLEELPVVRSKDSLQFLGIVTRRDVLSTLDREALRRKMLLSRFVTRSEDKLLTDRLELPEGFRIDKIVVPPELVGRTIGETNLRTQYHLNVLAVISPGRNGKEQRHFPDPNRKLEEGDILVVLGREDDIRQLYTQD
ncbi:MAG TPA: ClcB-like voltage-gated chloride channel protein [Candidatus Limnocylindrales bacterium]|nr:ClcB-like voltage-gated chloride channel protein [Candidatus Limnocylindrales bacterium]